MKAVCIIFVGVAAFSFCQTNTKVEPPVPARPDTWQKSKECGDQAEKVVRQHDERSIAFGGSAVTSWRNHYSTKYNRCFVRLAYLSLFSKDIKDYPKGAPTSVIYLIDAFERSEAARTATGPAIELACRAEEHPEECRQLARELYRDSCQIDEQPADCAKAAEIISEHMKN